MRKNFHFCLSFLTQLGVIVVVVIFVGDTVAFGFYNVSKWVLGALKSCTCLGSREDVFGSNVDEQEIKIPYLANLIVVLSRLCHVQYY
jgi:hypothetical protein